MPPKRRANDPHPPRRSSDAGVFAKTPGAVSRNPMKVTPLHSAAAGRHNALVQVLLGGGAPVNAKQEHGWTALHAAAQNGDQGMVDLLLKYGANPKARNDDGLTPDQLAHEKGHAEIAERLRAA